MSVNYFKMKNDDLIECLKKLELEIPVHSNGNLNRKEAASALMAIESGEEREARNKNSRTLCVIHGDDTEAGQQAVFVGINNYEANIPRETEVEFPTYVYEYLDGLYTIEYIPMEDEKGNLITNRKHVKRFKITVIDQYIKED